MLNQEFYIDPRKLKPTQFCLGFKEVEFKKQKILKMSKQEYEKYLIEKITPVVLAPNNEIYLVDHHHHSKSIIELGRKDIYVKVIADYRHLSLLKFKKMMKKNKYLNLLDENSKQRKFEELPSCLNELRHDLYRSLAWAVREKKAFIKRDDILYFEFRWAEFFRSYIPEKLLIDFFDLALDLAVKLAKSEKASHLPGFKGKNKTKY